MENDIRQSNIAWIYFKQGLYKEAESLYQQALAVREETFGQNHPEVARSERRKS